MNEKVEQKLVQILNEMKYGEVILKVVDGNVVMIYKTEQYKI